MEPLVAAVWSCDPATSLDYPARYLFTFLEHHGMLCVFGSPEWRTVTGGSRTYVAAVAAGLPDVRLDTKVTSVREVADGVEVTDGNGATTTFDAVVIATHPSHALGMLEEPTDLQRELLSALPYSSNPALLHTDTSLLPDAHDARASWNFFRPASETGEVTVTYDLTRLQRLPTDTHYLVTLGGEDLVDPATVIDRMEYEHPLYTPESVAAQRRLPEINTDRVAFAGAYHGWGFHEDGARSGLAAATHLGLPWTRTATVLPDPGRFETTIRHTRRTPFRRSFEHTSTLLARRPRRPARPRRAGPLRGPRPPRLARRHAARQRRGLPRRQRRDPRRRRASRHDPDGRPRRARSATASTRSASSGASTTGGRQAGVVVEVHNTYGDRHAYLVHPDEQGRATHRQGDVRLAVPRHRRQLRHRRAGPDRPAPRRGHPARPRHRRAGRLRAVQRQPDRRRAPTCRSARPSGPRCAAAR